MRAHLRTRDRRPLRWRVMSRCSTSGTGTACECFWPTTSSSISRCTRSASAVRRSVCSSHYTPRSTAYQSPRPGFEGREVIAVFEDRANPKPSYIMWLEWRDGRISFIHDYRYVRYVTADAELTLAPETKPAHDGAAQ